MYVSPWPGLTVAVRPKLTGAWLSAMVDYLLCICRDTGAMIGDNLQHMEKWHYKNSKNCDASALHKRHELNMQNVHVCKLHNYVCYVRNKMMLLFDNECEVRRMCVKKLWGWQVSGNNSRGDHWGVKQASKEHHEGIKRGWSLGYQGSINRA